MTIIAKAVDCYSPLTAASAKALKAAGYVAVGRYLGHLTHGWSKALTPGEVSAIRGAGLAIISIWEGAGDKLAYFTYSQGLQDGAQAVTEAKALGQPAGTPIYFAVDFDTADRDMPQIRLYLDGVRRNLGPYKLGVYGSFRTLSNVAADYYWQTCAWSYGQISPRSCMHQSQVDTTAAGVHVDIDDVFRDPGWWPGNPLQEHTITTPEATYDVLVNGKVFRAIVVGGSTYVLWTALQATGAKYNYKGNGVMSIDGKDVQGVIYGGDTYLPWTALPGVKATKVEWAFSTQ
ncbi:DUF1906 domain-containing protein [Alicyclobacillus macrosporangiidus]|uniref:Rv2525c-like glycoside hydrolase-like domain-containing protein n=1 Tax=Alicyclobacillus macrosporangiidus TaxID=392015 RepID=A0A1I7IET1_9BACL|nr:DUF1906 domain-containing protein [Alicyclobacillus macrosporangiidus]SFU71439.1 protein of unknown function [Alicyclobacillus macrosporangiidus]